MSRSDVLVDADWVQAHLDDPGIVLVEVDEDTSAYEKGHIRGAVRVDWKTELQDPVRRDFVDKTGFESLLSEKGIANDDLVVLYGGNKRVETGSGVANRRRGLAGRGRGSVGRATSAASGLAAGRLRLGAGAGAAGFAGGDESDARSGGHLSGRAQAH